MSETELQGNIMEALNRHRLVLFCRNNTVGTAKVKGRYITIGKKSDGDIYGMMKPSGRYFEIEVKLPGEEKKNPERYKQQAQRIVDVRNGGGAAGFATSIEQAYDIIMEQ